jgi:hypothetical protein
LLLKSVWYCDLLFRRGAPRPLHELPVPLVFIIDATGTIRYVYSNPDYTVRLASDALLAAAQTYAALVPVVSSRLTPYCFCFARVASSR